MVTTRLLATSVRGVCGFAVAAALLVPSDALGQNRRARLSEDLAHRLEVGDVADSRVILTGTDEQVDLLVARHGLRLRQRIKSGAVVDVPAGALSALAADGGADHLSTDQVVRSSMAVTNTAIGADLVQAGTWAAGAAGLTGAGVGVAVLDSGVANVAELRGRVVASIDLTDDRGKGNDHFGHGTHLAGIIAACGKRQAEKTRLEWRPAHTIINVKVLDEHGAGYASTVIRGIDWVIENRARYNIRVINLSLGGPVMQSWREDPLCQAVERAYRAGIVVVAAAGNWGRTADGKTLFGRGRDTGELAARHHRWGGEHEGDAVAIG